MGKEDVSYEPFEGQVCQHCGNWIGLPIDENTIPWRSVNSPMFEVRCPACGKMTLILMKPTERPH